MCLTDQADMAGSRANAVHLSKLNPLLGSGGRPTGGSMSGSGYLSGQPPSPLAITSGAGQDQDVDRKRKDYNPGGYGCNGTTRCSCCACVMFDHDS